jgi:hypothetical protein
MNWVHALHNETNSEQVRNFLEELTCNLSAGDIPNNLLEHDKKKMVQPVRSKNPEYEEDYDDNMQVCLRIEPFFITCLVLGITILFQ